MKSWALTICLVGLLVAGLSSVASQSVTSEAEKPKRTLHHTLYSYAKKICDVPENFSPLVMVYMEWFVMQKFYPDMAKTFTSMLNGMTNLNSKAAPHAVCVGKFISVPRNEYWESRLDLDAKATQMNAHPPVVLTEVYADGSFDVAVNPLY